MMEQANAKPRANVFEVEVLGGRGSVRRVLSILPQTQNCSDDSGFGDEDNDVELA
jgi:hypothetical protein